MLRMMNEIVAGFFVETLGLFGHLYLSDPSSLAGVLSPKVIS